MNRLKFKKVLEFYDKIIRTSNEERNRLMKDFKKSIQQFHDTDFHTHQETYEALARTHSPHTLVITCGDSRINVESLLQAGPGEVFQIRNIANIVPAYDDPDPLPSIQAGLDFTVTSLQVEDIILLGHINCGGCNTCLNPPANIDDMPHLKHWVARLNPVKESIAYQLAEIDDPVAQSDLMEKTNIIAQYEHLLTHPVVANRVAEGKLRVHGWHFHTDEGFVEAYDPETETFVRI